MILLVSTPLTAAAVTPREIAVTPLLSFTGTTADCSAEINALNTTDAIHATIKLWRGSFCLCTWTAEGEGSLFWSDTFPVIKGTTYTLTVDAYIAGARMDRASVTGTC